MSSQRITTSAEAKESLARESELRKANRRFPEESELMDVLTAMLQRSGLAKGPVVIESRDRSGRSSTCANEVVKCRLDGAPDVKLLCKYGKGNAHPGFGHRKGIEYELRVYDELLTSLGLSTPVFYGSHFDPVHEQYWLVLEYLEGGLTVNKGPQPDAIISASQWIGTFHTCGKALLDRRSTDWLITYDRDYFAGWAQRTFEYSEPLHARYPWLASLCRGYVDFVTHLLALPRTLIHGEYTVHNVLLRTMTPGVRSDRVASKVGGVGIAPIDWESAAVSFAEIDIASIIDGMWPEDVQRVCWEQYKQFRWGHDVPADCEDNLKAGQLYVNLRWLGDRPAKTLLATNAFRFDRLQKLGRDLNLI